MNTNKKGMRIRKPARDKNKDYVDNQKLYEVVKKYKEDCKKAEEEGKPIPIMPNYIGEAAYKISERLGYTYSYRGYPFLDEMISDGVLFCIKGLRSFNCEKYTDVFTYFTMAVRFSFWQRIEKEKKYLYTKYKMIDKATHDYNLHEMEDSNGDVLLSDVAVDKMHSFIREFEESMAKKKIKDTQELDE